MCTAWETGVPYKRACNGLSKRIEVTNHMDMLAQDRDTRCVMCAGHACIPLPRALIYVACTQLGALIGPRVVYSAMCASQVNVRQDDHRRGQCCEQVLHGRRSRGIYARGASRLFETRARALCIKNGYQDT